MLFAISAIGEFFELVMGFTTLNEIVIMNFCRSARLFAALLFLYRFKYDFSINLPLPFTFGY